MKNFKLVFRLGLLLFLVTLCGAAEASEIKAFGPKQYVRTTGAPNIYSDTVTAQPGEAWLVIKNGLEIPEKNDDKRVRSGVVSLNGTVLFSHDDFKHQTYILEAPVSLGVSNDLRIELEGIPGTFISLEIVQISKDPVVDFLASELHAKADHCPDYVDIALRLTNVGEGEIPAGVSVAFYKGHPEEGGIFIGSAASVEQLKPTEYEDVVFHWPSPGVEKASLYARVDDDGSGGEKYSEVDEANNLVSLEAFLCPIVPTGESSVAGRVIDAVTGDYLSGIHTLLYANDNGSPGAVVASIETDAEGGFLFSGLAAGAYILAAAPSGYIAVQRPVAVPEDLEVTNQDLVLSPVLADDEVRIVLTWGANPADLEAHLTAPNPDGCRYHCYYWSKTIPDASLDLDDRDGYGPETITIAGKVPGTYRFYVYDFTNRYSNSNWLARSGAEVKVYAGNREPVVFSAPNSYGNVWHVFDLDGETGQVIPVSIMSRQSEPGRIDYPTITSTAPSSVYWNSPYSYQVKATDPDNDTLAYSLLQAPAGMTIDPATGLIKWVPAGSQSGWYTAEVRVDDGRCGEVTQTFSVFVNSQPTAQFSVNPCSGVNPGGTITLTWSTTLASTVLIDQGIGQVPASGSLTIPSPGEPTVYTLTAFNDAALTKRTVPSSPYAYFYFSPNQIYEGGSATLRWDPRCAASASIDHDIGAVSSAGSLVVTPTGTTSYKMTVSNAALTSNYWATLYVIPPPAPSPPSGTISISPLCNMTPGAPMTLSWSTIGATKVTIAPEVGEVAASGSMVVHPSAAGTYTLTATGAGGTIARYVTFPNYPSLSFSASPSYAIDLGNSVTLQWSASCADTVTMSQGVGELAASGSLTVTPQSLPVTYTVTAVNERGPVSRSVTLYQIPPSGTLTASPTVLKVGDSSTLAWASTRATTCSITPDVGTVDCNGTVQVTPAQPTTYTLTMVGSGGTLRRSVYVGFVAPMADLKASSLSIKEGESVRLTWVFANATTCAIDQGIGEVALGGEVTVSPAVSTTYTMTAKGPGGTAVDRVTINVTAANPPPTVSLATSNNIIYRGGSAVLNWQSSLASSLNIEPGVGVVAAAGTETVTPEVTTTYTATATGPGGTTTAKVTITVLQPLPSMTLRAEPAGIMLGESAVLSWTSSDTDRITFSQGIGQVALQGSLTVSPTTTTTYTATATGLGGTTTKSVIVTVTYPAPTVTLSAQPSSIRLGEGSLLIWTSNHADTLTISPDIGAVAKSGSLSVAPVLDTTYTITANGPGGVATSQVAVTVIQPVPTASIGAVPMPITAGESTTLSWSSQYAQACSIGPGIGPVPCTGQMTVSPVQTTDYVLTAEGLGGTSTAQVSITVKPASPEITITAPLDGATVYRPDVLVTGVIYDSQGLEMDTSGAEIGLTINGKRVQRNGAHFFINDLALTAGENVITAEAAFADGTVAVDTITVNLDPTQVGDWVDLYSNLESGVAPLTVNVRADMDLSSALTGINYRYEGPDAVQITLVSKEELNCTFNTPGVYAIVYTAVDSQGGKVAGKLMINVLDRNELDGVLKAKWGGMKNFLSSQNIEGGLAYFATGAKDKYRRMFTALGAKLPQIISGMQDIEMIYAEADGAKYRVNRTHNIDGTPVTITYYIYFGVDGDGKWKIEQF